MIDGLHEFDRGAHLSKFTSGAGLVTMIRLLWSRAEMCVDGRVSDQWRGLSGQSRSR